MREERTPDSSVSRSEDTSVPPMHTLPEVGLSSVPIRFSRVDFPEPEGPTMATNSPSSTLRDTPLQLAFGDVVAAHFDAVAREQADGDGNPRHSTGLVNDLDAELL